MSTVMITGGAGLIGTAARKYYENKGWDVKTLDLNSTDLDGKKIDFVGDIVDFEPLVESLRGVDGILHLAAVSRVIDAELDKDECTRVNLLGTERILLAASKAKCKWFIFGSSREVYGEPKTFPVTEEQGSSPINHYGHIKVQGEVMVQEFCEKNDIFYSNLRFSNVYGHPSDHKTRLINAFLWNALHSTPLEIHGGGQVFDFTYVEDTASAIYEASRILDECEKNLPSMHILPGEPVKIENLANLVIEFTGSNSKIFFTTGRDYDVEKFYGDPGRMRELLGISCSTDIREGLIKTIQLFKSHMSENGATNL